MFKYFISLLEETGLEFKILATSGFVNINELSFTSSKYHNLKQREYNEMEWKRTE